MIDHSRTKRLHMSLSDTALREAARAETLSLDSETPLWKRSTVWKTPLGDAQIPLSIAPGTDPALAA